MTDLVPFTDNYTDLSNQDGFQFEFRCERCGNGFRSAFRRDPRSLGQKLARGVTGLLGGPLAEVGYAADRLLDRGTNSAAKDDALRAATAEIAPNFHQCRGCGDWVCGDGCWNEDIGQCARCSPIAVEELAQLQAEARRRQLQERLESVDLVGNTPLSRQAQPRCPACGAQAGGGKFCAECGSSLVTRRSCTGCGTETQSTGRFCPECGQQFPS
ncbi:Double zinc ribbon [Jatrophihabitans endophyticus]|uniref:Double zinc ribbon n=1 Tax=Jatrophihabitans endophyticus TaxID=1206085 RepID=A0A1M5DCL2_9ACTN|nr:zinc ribbon domain-containing protein [Jatrophihabitans endophyticus]SHF64749.1 Double zinc ribbon [Jatrophihabitans endophyticus]